ncbi:hypothetical protein GCM10010329_86000 [Streptomyces spiroverticillatus]|uniref:Uncharacterized protein n=1 Tax=Streptomyces finlayi TaxID=67296 RepID=A0A919CG13_9ACTN|nr:hypothetical protein [Streptomyces finlayi]GHA50791.1 hypothetical protein GCM10010329_86000 [Streptomyces spiroverticillatus]GHD19897.1 hypothetical protein GCM10010334_83890 [Streptomyces finlayi]
MPVPDTQPEPPATPGPGPTSNGVALALWVIGLVVALILVFGAAYLTWRHPSVATPITVGIAVLTVIIAAVGFIVTTAHRRR